MLAALGTAVSRSASSSGESLASVQRYDANIEEATTPSLEALKAYSQGMSDAPHAGRLRVGAVLQARDRARSRIRPRLRAAGHGLLEPAHASAEARRPRAPTSSAIRSASASASTSRRATYTTVKPDVAKAIEPTASGWPPIRTISPRTPNVGAAVSSSAAKRTEAITHLEESATALRADQPLGHVNLAQPTLAMSRFAEAKKALEKALKLQESVSARHGLFVIGMLTGDQALPTRR